MEMSEMVRTRGKSLERLVEVVKDQFGVEKVRIAIVHSQDRETAEELKEMLESVMDIAELIFTELSISVAANLAPKIVGIVAMPNHL
jgi:fatty acid-binding protein DegV